MDASAAATLLEFAEASTAAMAGADAAATFAEIEQRSVDLDAALACFVAHEETDSALRLVNALAKYWDDRQRLEKGWAAYMLALDLPGGDPTLRARAWINAGFLALWSGHDERSPIAFDCGLDLSRGIQEQTLEARALGGLARVALRSDVAEGRRIATELLALSDATNDQPARSDALHLLGVAAQIDGDLLEARTWMRQRLEIVRAQADEISTAVEVGNLGTVERQLGNLDEAAMLIREALEIAERRGDEFIKPFAISGLAAVATDRGDDVRAATLIGATEGVMERSGISWPSDEKPHYDRMLAVLPVRMGSAAFERARNAGRSMSTRDAVTLALAAVGSRSV